MDRAARRGRSGMTSSYPLPVLTAIGSSATVLWSHVPWSRIVSGSVLRIDPVSAWRAEQYDGVWLPRLVHAGCRLRHPWHGQAPGRGPFVEQPFDVGGGNMPFHDVAANHRGMAGLQRVGHVPRLFDLGHVRGVANGDAETRVPHVVNPDTAAAAAWVLPGDDLRQ